MTNDAVDHVIRSVQVTAATFNSHRPANRAANVR